MVLLLVYPKYRVFLHVLGLVSARALASSALTHTFSPAETPILKQEALQPCEPSALVNLKPCRESGLINSMLWHPDTTGTQASISTQWSAALYDISAWPKPA